jgi:glycosyl transferase family 2
LDHIQNSAAATKEDFRVSRLSNKPCSPAWSIAVFAHNEASNIRSALESIAAAAGGEAVEVYVLANGCTDSTGEQVRACASILEKLWLVETDVADKANAWNLYIHKVLLAEDIGAFDTFFFMDGDVTLAAGTMPLLASALNEVPSADAAGGMPATGRDRDAWRQRMVSNAMLAGNYYALRGSFVRCLKERQVRMPVGLVGEDFLISWLVASNDWRDGEAHETGPHCVFHADAEFSFRSLSPWRPADIRTWLRRKWRYTLRTVQHQMLVLLLTQQGMSAMPDDVEALYRTGPIPSRVSLVGRDRVLRLIAVQWIRAKSLSATSAKANKIRSLD